ncbi:hypothetical protein JCM8097_000594 [Rhodosporidiobolus ruineniae]
MSEIAFSSFALAQKPSGDGFGEGEDEQGLFEAIVKTLPCLRLLRLYENLLEIDCLESIPSLSFSSPPFALFSPSPIDTASWLADFPNAILQVKVGASEENLRRLLPTAPGIRFYMTSISGRYDEHNPARAASHNILLRHTLSNLLGVVSMHPNPLPHLRLVSIPPPRYPAYSSDPGHVATVAAALADLDIECIVEENLDGELDSLVSPRCLEVALEAQAEEQA